MKGLIPDTYGVERHLPRLSGPVQSGSLAIKWRVNPQDDESDLPVVRATQRIDRTHV